LREEQGSKRNRQTQVEKRTVKRRSRRRRTEWNSEEVELEDGAEVAVEVAVSGRRRTLTVGRVTVESVMRKSGLWIRSDQTEQNAKLVTVSPRSRPRSALIVSEEIVEEAETSADSCDEQCFVSGRPNDDDTNDAASANTGCGATVAQSDRSESDERRFRALRLSN
jgi:hypothetical protein